MTTEEFSNEFDTLLNSYSTFDKFSENEVPYTIKLDEYEKSVFLTRAQEELIIDLYSGKSSLGNSFEQTEEIRRYLNGLVKTYITTDKQTGHEGLSRTSTFFELPGDLWFITYESVNLEDDRLGCMNGEEVSVVPTSQDEYSKITKNPFRGSGKRRALRLDLGNNVVEIVSEYNVAKYLARYLAKPEPIILTDLTDGLSINGVSIKTECKLNPVIHGAILGRAVKMAIISKTLNAGKQ